MAFFIGRRGWRCRVRQFVRGGKPYLRIRGMLESYGGYMVRHPRGSQYRVCPLLSPEVKTPKKQINSLDAVIPYACPPQTLCLVGCSSPFMRFAQHLSALRTWCKQCSPWWVKTQRAPSRHCRDASVYGRTTTAMHDMSTPLCRTTSLMWSSTEDLLSLVSVPR